MTSISAPYRLPIAPQGERHKVMVRGARTRYWVYGPTQAARSVVMVHGFRGDHHGLEPLASYLDDYRVLVPDLPGFGESEPFPTGEHSVAAYARWLSTFVAATVGEDPVLLGHSFGSVVVAASLAADQPATRAVLINPIGAPALSGPHLLLSRLTVAYYRMAATLPGGAGDRLLRSTLVVRALSAVMTTSQDPPTRRWILAEHQRYFNTFANRRCVIEAFEASVGDDVGHYAPHLEARVLLIGGDRDDITPVPVHHTLNNRFPNADLVIIGGVGHLIHYEAPAEAAEAIRGFLEASAS